jgi:hypothetical protein
MDAVKVPDAEVPDAEAPERILATKSELSSEAVNVAMAVADAAAAAHPSGHISVVVTETNTSGTLEADNGLVMDVKDSHIKVDLVQDVEELKALVQFDESEKLATETA